MKTLLYISGWLGAGRNSGTFRWLEKTYPDINLDCLAPGGTIDLTNLRKELAQKLSEEKGTLIVANSYGCFLASFFPDQPAVWVNPSLFPSRTLPEIASLSNEEIQKLSQQETERNQLYSQGHLADATPVISDSDELIPDHGEGNFTAHTPIIVPGGHHKLSDEQRTQYLRSAIDSQIRH